MRNNCTLLIPSGMAAYAASRTTIGIITEGNYVNTVINTRNLSPEHKTGDKHTEHVGLSVIVC